MLTMTRGIIKTAIADRQNKIGEDNGRHGSLSRQEGGLITSISQSFVNHLRMDETLSDAENKRRKKKDGTASAKLRPSSV